MRPIPPLRTSVARTLPLAAAALLLTAGCGLTGEKQAVAPPAAPIGVTAQAGSSSTVHLMWNRPGPGAKVTGYEIYQGDKKVKDLPGEQYMVDISGLKPSSSYSFTVRARDDRGTLSPESRAATATTPKVTKADKKPPTVPGALAGRAQGSRSALLTWKKSTDDQGVVSYDIYQSGTKIHSAGPRDTRTVVTGLRPGTAYVFTVKARDAADNSSQESRTVRLTTAEGADDGRDTAPTDFRAVSVAKAGAYHLELSWDPPETDAVVMQYRIQLNREQTTSLIWGGEPPTGRAKHSFYVDRKKGVTYRVRIQAMLPDGTYGAYSQERTVVTGG
ncbi:fibronectin type III domain-containing protein [Streptomyces sp. NPDC059578]|uniref:fibronectin type III domain-containing protein n=1 Tax=Streptomyces sp. NPDC059578 TaxID=3346874 RepID=UPI003695B92F